MEIKLTLGLPWFGNDDIINQLIDQCGEYSRKTDGTYMDVVLGDKFNVVVEGKKTRYVTLQIKPERTL
jgi:hypothetical protein